MRTSQPFLLCRSQPSRSTASGALCWPCPRPRRRTVAEWQCVLVPQHVLVGHCFMHEELYIRALFSALCLPHVVQWSTRRLNEETRIFSDLAAKL